MTLLELEPGQLAVISAHADAAQARAFGAMGLRPGVVVELIQRAAFGGRVIGVGSDRLALDASAAKSVLVAELPS